MSWPDIWVGGRTLFIVQRRRQEILDSDGKEVNSVVAMRVISVAQKI